MVAGGCWQGRSHDFGPQALKGPELLVGRGECGESTKNDRGIAGGKAGVSAFGPGSQI